VSIYPFNADFRFGGIVLSQSISAGFATLPEDDSLQLYSVQGTYLGPSSTTHITTFRVEKIRTTKRFCTRLVKASQQHVEGERTIFIALLDWHAAEPSLLVYSKPPMYPPYPSAEELLPYKEYAKTILSPKEEKSMSRAFALGMRLLDIRPCPESTGGKSALGTKRLDDWDESIPIYKHNYAKRVRVNEDLSTQAQQCASLR
jgi:acyl-CoA thioesterase II